MQSARAASPGQLERIIDRLLAKRPRIPLSVRRHLRDELLALRTWRARATTSPIRQHRALGPAFNRRAAVRRHRRNRRRGWELVEGLAADLASRLSRIDGSGGRTADLDRGARRAYGPRASRSGSVSTAPRRRRSGVAAARTGHRGARRCGVAKKPLLPSLVVDRVFGDALTTQERNRARAVRGGRPGDVANGATARLADPEAYHAFKRGHALTGNPVSRADGGRRSTTSSTPSSAIRNSRPRTWRSPAPTTFLGFYSLLKPHFAFAAAERAADAR